MERRTLPYSLTLLPGVAGVLVGAVVTWSLRVSTESAADATYTPPIGRASVLAYGGYYALLLAIFFLPLLRAERVAALGLIREGQGLDEADREHLETRFGVGVPFSQRLTASALVLSPLLGAIVSNLVGR